MSSYIKYYQKKGSSDKPKEALFIDARGHYPQKLGFSEFYYYVSFEGKDYRIEDFERFCLDNELMDIGLMDIRIGSVKYINA